MNHVLNHSAAPDRDRALAGVVHDLAFLVFLVPIFAQVGIADAQSVWQDDAFLVVEHALVFAKGLRTVLEVSVEHVFEHAVAFSPQLNDLVVLVAVHTHDALGFIQLDLHGYWLRCCQGVL